MPPESDPEQNAKVECPICGDFVGEPNSVRNHITASEDDEHKGEDGADYLAKLAERAKEKTPLPSNPFKDTNLTETDLEDADSEIKQAKKVETEDGEEGYSFVIAGALGLLLWLWAKGGMDSNQPDNNPANQPPYL